jgi:hypothetical protein
MQLFVGNLLKLRIQGLTGESKWLLQLEWPLKVEQRLLSSGVEAEEEDLQADQKFLNLEDQRPQVPKQER